ncbi:MAG TPA: DMT family transporter [Thermoleophilaceae bacterium]|jgi:drug/metabolite transporter (DMT)-like permease|nr:DMT family transporter [Thermoleophilaceae bacterium]
MMLAAGVLLAALSAGFGQVGCLLRQRGAVAAPDVDVHHPLRSAIALFRSKWWTIGYALAFVAYLLHIGALGLASLSIVQAVLAGGVVLLAVIAERFFGFELGKRQWVGVVLASVGLALLALSGASSSGQHSANYSVAAMVAFEAVLVGAGTALILSCRRERARSQPGVLLAISAGLLFTVTDVAIKALSGKLDTSLAGVFGTPFLPIAVAGGVAAFFAAARSLQLGPAVPVIAVTSIAGTASAIPAGIIVFGDPVGSDALAVGVRSLAFLMVVVAGALIPAPVRAAAASRRGARAQDVQATAQQAHAA